MYPAEQISYTISLVFVSSFAGLVGVHSNHQRSEIHPHRHPNTKRPNRAHRSSRPAACMSYSWLPFFGGLREVLLVLQNVSCLKLSIYSILCGNIFLLFCSACSCCYYCSCSCFCFSSSFSCCCCFHCFFILFSRFSQLKLSACELNVETEATLTLGWKGPP